VAQLTSLRWPERELVEIPAAKMYSEPVKPLVLPPALSAQHANDDVLDLADVFGKRIVETRLYRNVTIREENSSAALEVMSRFAANPRWLIYLPPTMSPSETSKKPGLLEHPDEAFAYFRREGVARVVCEEKHMGSRAVVVVCRDADAAKARFGVTTGETGVVVTRTGRQFFNDEEIAVELIDRVRAALDATAFWEEHQTGWALLDCELMPWSVKAQDLIRDQYAAVGAAARGAVADALPALEAAASRGIDLGDLLPRSRERATLVQRYVEAYQRYSWPVQSLDDLKLAPFHLLATEGAVHIDKSHERHMQTLAKVCAADPKLLLATAHRTVALEDAQSSADATAWWEELTSRGGEGMVVKPLDFVTRGAHGLVQPAVKCRGPEYLRIIYGPEYSVPENLDRLRSRGLGAKRSLALREFALGIEGLERFVRREPLRRVHECVFGVLALESEPVDPRL
jgi:protein phosphatase